MPKWPKWPKCRWMWLPYDQFHRHFAAVSLLEEVLGEVGVLLQLPLGLALFEERHGPLFGVGLGGRPPEQLVVALLGPGHVGLRLIEIDHPLHQRGADRGD